MEVSLVGCLLGKTRINDLEIRELGFCKSNKQIIFGQNNQICFHLTKRWRRSGIQVATRAANQWEALRSNRVTKKTAAMKNRSKPVSWWLELALIFSISPMRRRVKEISLQLPALSTFPKDSKKTNLLGSRLAFDFLIKFLSLSFLCFCFFLLPALKLVSASAKDLLIQLFLHIPSLKTPH